MMTWFHADAVALRRCFIPVLLRYLQPTIRRQFFKMTKSMAEASSAAPHIRQGERGTLLAAMCDAPYPLRQTVASHHCLWRGSPGGRY